MDTRPQQRLRLCIASRGKKCVTLKVEGATQRGGNRKIWKEVEDKDKDTCKWRVIIRGNFSDSNGDSDAENCILIVCVWCWLTQLTWIKGR